VQTRTWLDQFRNLTIKRTALEITKVHNRDYNAYFSRLIRTTFMLNTLSLLYFNYGNSSGSFTSPVSRTNLTMTSAMSVSVLTQRLWVNFPHSEPECNRLLTIADPGEGPGGGGVPPKNFFWRPGPPLSQGLDDRPPPLIWRSGSATVSWAASVFSRVFIVTHAPLVALAFGRPRNIPPREEKTTTSVTYGTLKPNFR